MKRYAITSIITLVFLVFASQSQAALIGQYDFSGNANDGSANLNHGSVIGATLTSDRFGNANSAYDFDGIDDYISIGKPVPTALSPTDALSISVWVRADAYANNGNGYVGGIVASQYDYHRTGYSVMLDYRNSAHGGVLGGVHFQVGAGSNWWTTSSQGTTATAVDLGDWTHIVAIADPNDIYSVYLNGTLTTNWIAGSGISYSNMNHLLFGRNIHGGGDARYFDGAIDDIQIYDHALSSTEIQALYSGSIPEPASLWLFATGLIGMGGLGIRRISRAKG